MPDTEAEVAATAPPFIQEVVKWAMQAGNAEALFAISRTLRIAGEFDEADAWSELARRNLPDRWELVVLAALTGQQWHGEDISDVKRTAEQLLDDLEIPPQIARKLRAELEVNARRHAFAGAYADHTSSPGTPKESPCAQ